MNSYDLITINPLICHGKPVISGTRILVSNILSELASKASFDDIIAEYPSLKTEHILAALAFGSEMSNFEFANFEYQNVAVG
jgi:uncharacterized protein (DUF433 family)